MKIENYSKFTVILRGYTLEQADRIIYILREYKDKFAVEVTLNTSGALDMIRALSQKYHGQIHIGAGTVKTFEDVKNAIAAGAEFLLSPIGFTKEMIDYAKEQGIIVIPAAMTPSEIETQFNMGADIVKVFPARALGSKFFSDVQVPLGKLRLMAVGGVDASNYQEFFNNGCQYVGMGTGMFGDLNLDSASDEEIRSVLNKYFN